MLQWFTKVTAENYQRIYKFLISFINCPIRSYFSIRYFVEEDLIETQRLQDRIESAGIDFLIKLELVTKK